ncbi:MAG: hypothetical protein WDM77_20340 [Steroidobacteraceae bacterium]
MKPSKRMTRALIACAAILPCLPNLGHADDFTLGDLMSDAKSYLTAPVRWDSSDWLFLGGALAAIGVAHDFDERGSGSISHQTAHPG